MSADMNVPSPPTGDGMQDWLRWVLYVMDDTDLRMGFVASILSNLCKYGNLTERQSAAIEKVIAVTRTRYEAGSLDIQAGATPWTEPTAKPN